MCEVAVVTTGFFDGVHLGHRHVIQTVVSAARERGEEAIVVTFWPHPRMVLQQDARELRLLTSLEEKKALLAACGIDRVEVLPFDRAFARLTAAEYLQLLRERFGASLVVMGYDNRIGSDKKTAAELEDYCSRNPSSLRSSSLPTSLRAVGPLPLIAGGGKGSGEQQSSISSTRIRKALEQGRVKEANAMLGYPYELYGVVVAGNRMGRTIGFPTANMQLYEPLKLVPGDGVYAVDVEVLGRQWRGMCNIGLKPTVGGKVRTIETHILGFDEDIYGLPIRLHFRGRIRDEIKFPSLDALRSQLEKDRDAVKQYING